MKFIVEIEIGLPVPETDREFIHIERELDEVERELSFLLNQYKNRKPKARRRRILSVRLRREEPRDTPSLILLTSRTDERTL